MKQTHAELTNLRNDLILQQMDLENYIRNHTDDEPCQDMDWIELQDEIEEVSFEISEYQA